MIKLRQFKTEDLALFWETAYSDPQAEWTKWNGPYFKDVLPYPDIKLFLTLVKLSLDISLKYLLQTQKTVGL